MQFRLTLTLAGGLLAACTVGDDGGGFTTGDTGGDGAMTMTLTTMTTASSLTAAGSGSGTGSADDTGGTTSGAADSTGDTGVAACPGECVAFAPEDWNGPVATVDAAPDAPQSECTGSFPRTALVSFDGFEFEPADCGCSCGPALDTECEQSTTLIDYGTAENCDGPELDTINLVNQQCTSATLQAGSYMRMEPIELLDAGFCNGTGSTELPTPQFDQRVTACEAELSAAFACDADAGLGCLEQLPQSPLAPQLCIWQEGEHECPADTQYTEQRVLYDTFADDRSCSTCTCGDVLGACDTSSVTVYDIGGCVIGSQGVAGGEGFCTQVGESTLGARLSVQEPSAFCPPMPVEALGEATPAEPTTLCCTR